MAGEAKGNVTASKQKQGLTLTQLLPQPSPDNNSIFSREPVFNQINMGAKREQTSQKKVQIASES